MVTEHLYYTISHHRDGWHAGPAGHPSGRVFATKEAALGWCKAQAQQGSLGARSSHRDEEAEVEIRLER